MVGNEEVAVHEEAVLATPFGTLLHFRKDVDTPQPRDAAGGAAVGPFRDAAARTRCARCCPITTSMSPIGTMRATCRWPPAVRLRRLRRARDPVPETLGPGVHVIAVCQPCVQVLAAIAIMAEDGNPAQPRSMTLMAGPIDTRINPTRVNELATSKPIEWFEQNLIATRADALPGRRPQGLSGLCAAAGVHVDEPRAPREGASRPATTIWSTARSRQADAIRELLRRISGGARSAGRFLPRDRRARVPGCALAKGELDFRGRRSIWRRSGGRRCSRSRASATTSARSARPSPRTTSAPACGRT